MHQMEIGLLGLIMAASMAGLMAWRERLDLVQTTLLSALSVWATSRICTLGETGASGGWAVFAEGIAALYCVVQLRRGLRLC